MENMKNYLLIIFLFISAGVLAQETDKNKYLGEVVPLDQEGKILFTKEIILPGLTKDQIYTQMLEWTSERFKREPDKEEKGSVVYANSERGQIACRGEEYLIFLDKALALDRARMIYQLSIYCTVGKCSLEVNNISYLYPESRPQKILADEWITDAHALNKKKTKLYPGSAKFRIKTVDFVEDLWKEAEKSFPGWIVSQGKGTVETWMPPIKETTSPVVPLPVNDPVVAVTSSSEIAGLTGYKQVAPDKIPGNIIKLLTESWSLITAGSENKFNTMTASWGGVGRLYEKPVSFCFINPARYTYQLMEKDDCYTISFYTEAYREALEYCGRNSGRDKDKIKEAGLTPITLPSGSVAFSEAWMILECKKMVSQPILSEGMEEPDLKEKWEGKPTHKMYIGEIINVWIK